MSLRPGDSVAEKSLAAARQHLLLFLWRELKPYGECIGDIMPPPFLAVTQDFKKGQHDTLKIGDWHLRLERILGR